ncbi:MAG: dipeptidyl-aminopeptidase B [Lasallia pustulata]|uniref:dipeptidyl-peptidase IV n=1 Tax=Lasallia pustulata TaxID=136370 RepID=A0A5M8PM73_9LECA|nr:MAG: dipeptidyl-aminopeptidase B [Lasallia pustulata]
MLGPEESGQVMAVERYADEEETQPLTQVSATEDGTRPSFETATSASTTSIILEQLDHNGRAKPLPQLPDKDEQYDEEEAFYQHAAGRPVEKRFRRIMWSLGALCLGGWVLALVLFLSRQTYKHSSTIPHDPAATASRGSGKAVTLDQVLGGQWRPRSHDITWIEGANSEDGLLLDRSGAPGRDYLVVEDVRSRKADTESYESRTLMKSGVFHVNGVSVYPSKVWPSRNLEKVLVMSDEQHNWRHSSTGRYWIFDVKSQIGEALDPANPDGRIQLATWSPTSDSVVFTRDNNMFLRRLSSSSVTQITEDGGVEVLYGVPDWVYEEEVFAGNTATWWSKGGEFIAFLRTNETTVPEYPIQYFVSRPSGTKPAPGEEYYPEVREIKYPKAGAPNPVVDLQFYDVSKEKVFIVNVDSDYPDQDRLITEVIWAGKDGKVLVKETNRESDILKVVLIDVTRRTGRVVRQVDVNAIDGGWFEVTEDTTFIPGDPGNGRPHDGYVDTVIYDGNDHLAYFTPLNNPHPIMLTSGDWEVAKAPSAVDLVRNLVYFIATKEAPIQRHVYSVKLDGSDLQPITDISKDGYYAVSFSTGAGYALLSYQGPDIPWQRVISTPSNPDRFEDHIEDNAGLAALAAQHELPINIYSTIQIDGYTLQVIERRPAHFNENKQYPVLFHLYGGPGSQTVDKRFTVDFQAYIAASLGYVVVTVDGRGTGFIGRKARCIIRGNIGYYEAKDQIETAKIWGKKKYVDASRMAIWGWSYGGFMTLKTLEQDGGKTFQYGMAVAPVTDWRFYDSIYTERYMHTPQHNPVGYDNASISNMTALQNTVRFLMMHGVADDNVHMQNSLTLLDKLDLAGVENYDVHVFPDSDHSIYFHNANRIVYDKLNNWLINAFNGEWLRTEAAVPLLNSGVS